MNTNMHKHSTFDGYVVSIGAALFLGVILWLLYRWVPDLMPFAIAYIIARPVYKLAREIDIERNL